MPAPTLSAFHDVLFPLELSEGMVGGSIIPVRFIEMPSGREQRIKLSAGRRRSWSSDVLAANPTLISTAISFWNARDGGSYGFRFLDVNEYAVTDEPLAPDGSPTVQLQKSYTSGAITRTQTIYLPAPGAVTLKKNGSAITEGVNYTLDDLTGLVTLTAVNSKSITGITQAASAVVTVGSSHGFATNDRVYISGVTGMTQINGRVGTVTATAASTITLNIASTSFSAYVSGGTAAKYLTTTDALTWTGTHHWPVTFRSQQQELSADFPFARNWRIELKELV